jgi:hypothetical protein
VIKNITRLLAVALLFSGCLSAATIKSKVVDPSGAPIGGGTIAAINRVGVLARTAAASNGMFELDAPHTPGTTVVVTAPGFNTRTLPPAEAGTGQLDIAPQVSSIDVVGSTIDLPATLEVRA